MQNFLIKTENQNSVLLLVSVKIGKDCNFFVYLFNFLGAYWCSVLIFVKACPLRQLRLRHPQNNIIYSLDFFFYIAHVSTSSKFLTPVTCHILIGYKSKIWDFLHISTRFIFGNSRCYKSTYIFHLIGVF
jgi:hypothetical protein